MEILSRLLSIRLKIIIMVTLIAISSIIAYLFHLQVVLMHNFFALGQRNYVRYEKVMSPRGNIIDMFGNLLATNKPVYSVLWQGTGNKQLTDSQIIALQELQVLLTLSSDSIDQIVATEKRSKKYCLAYDITFEQLSQLTERFPSHQNIIIENLFKRFYPYNSLASHIVGYLGLDSGATGRMGLELICDDSLKGQSGEVVKTINSTGHHLTCQEIKKALTGETIKTTLNLPLQLAAEKLFTDDFSGACIVIDPRTGALEVMVSRPSFDPNIFLDTLDHEQWHVLQEKKCFINRALNACYPPASLFKLVTLAAALETKLIKKDTCWHCFGHLDFAGRPYYCKKRQGHGVLDTAQAVTYSCNIPFYDIGKKIKIDTLADYAHRLGLGEKTSIIFNEKTGLIPTSEWKKATKGEPWWPGETLSAAIGQSFMLITPLQAACMIGAICEGYLVRPRILQEEPIVKRPVDVSQDTLQFLKKAMKSVIYRGTARTLGSLSNFEIYGKTGTAQTSDVSKCELGKQYLEHAWLVVYVRYKHHDPKILVLLVEHAGSSSVAVTIAHKLLKEYADLLDHS